MLEKLTRKRIPGTMIEKTTYGVTKQAYHQKGFQNQKKGKKKIIDHTYCFKKPKTWVTYSKLLDKHQCQKAYINGSKSKHPKEV